MKLSHLKSITFIIVYITVPMLLIIKKVILFNIYCYRGMIIDAIPSMEEITFFSERKDKRSLEEKIKDLILKRNDQIEISFWYSAATIMVWRRQHQQEVYKSLYILRQSSVVLTMKYYNVQRWNSTLSNKYFVWLERLIRLQTSKYP